MNSCSVNLTTAAKEVFVYHIYNIPKVNIRAVCYSYRSCFHRTSKKNMNYCRVKSWKTQALMQEGMAYRPTCYLEHVVLKQLI